MLAKYSSMSNLSELCRNWLSPLEYLKLCKLQQLKDEARELSASDEKRFCSLQQQYERELLQVRVCESDCEGVSK